MKLTRVQRERMTDSILKIQSVRTSLDAIESAQIPNAAEIEDCLETADESLKKALGYGAVGNPASGGEEKKIKQE